MQLRPEYAEAVDGVDWTLPLEGDEVESKAKVTEDLWRRRKVVATEVKWPDHQENTLAADIGARLVKAIPDLAHLKRSRIKYGAHNKERLAPETCGQAAHAVVYAPPLNHFARIDGVVMVYAQSWERARAAAAEVDPIGEALEHQAAARTHLVGMVARGLFEFVEKADALAMRQQKRLDPLGFIAAFGHIESLIGDPTRDTIAAAGQALELGREVDYMAGGEEDATTVNLEAV